MDPHLLLFLVTLLRCRRGSSVASLSANVLWAGEAESLALVQPAGRDGPNYGRTESPRRSLPWTKVQTIRREHGRAGPLRRLPGWGSVTSEPSQPLSCCPQGAWRTGGSPSSPPATASRDDGGLALYAAGRQVSRGPRRGCSAAVVTPELGHSLAGSRHHGGGSPGLARSPANRSPVVGTEEAARTLQRCY